MQKIRYFFLPLSIALIFGLMIFLAFGTTVSAMKTKKEPKRAILLVAFGTSVPEAAKALDGIEKSVREKHAGTEVRWAYTSKTVRARHAARGKVMDSPEIALSRLMDEGFTHVAVLSLHVVPGQEFHDLFHNAMRFSDMSGGFEKIVVARPLLGNHEDMTRVADALSKKYAVREGAGEGVVFIGHGNSRHPSDAIYAAMGFLFGDRDPNLFAGTVSGHPTADELVPRLAAAKVRKVRLVPLMTVAGEHARKDMAGDAPDSWKSILAKAGVTSEAVFTGLVEYPEIVRVWMDHLDDVLSQL
ncbi:MAG: sirohydrochlorin cobaltochelatase [Syntrophobacteraceae bacterium]